jgi:hypothetical protein
MVYGFTDYGRFGILKVPTLLTSGDPSPASLIATKAYSDFAEKCGSELVTQERRAAWGAVIYSAHGMSDESKKSLEANFFGKRWVWIVQC